MHVTKATLSYSLTYQIHKRRMAIQDVLLRHLTTAWQSRCRYELLLRYFKKVLKGLKGSFSLLSKQEKLLLQP